MCLQGACIRGCIATLVAFVWLSPLCSFTFKALEFKDSSTFISVKSGVQRFSSITTMVCEVMFVSKWEDKKLPLCSGKSGSEILWKDHSIIVLLNAAPIAIFCQPTLYKCNKKTHFLYEIMKAFWLFWTRKHLLLQIWLNLFLLHTFFGTLKLLNS